MKTHRERAETAVRSLYSDPAPSETWVEHAGEIIARETFPKELVKAAKGLADEIDAGPKHTVMTLEWLRKVRSALEAYKETP